MNPRFPSSLKKLSRRSVIATGLLLLAGAVGFALHQEFSGEFTPGSYTVPTLARAQFEVNFLENLLRGSRYSPDEMQARLRMLAASNKQGVRVTTENGGDPVDLGQAD